MKNIITMAVLVVVAMAVIPETAEAGRRGGGGRSGGGISKKFHLPSHSLPSIPVATPNFKHSNGGGGRAAVRQSGYAAAPYLYQSQPSDQPQNYVQHSNGVIYIYKEDCLRMGLELRRQPEYIQFMCSYFGITSP